MNALSWELANVRREAKLAFNAGVHYAWIRDAYRYECTDRTHGIFPAANGSGSVAQTFPAFSLGSGGPRR